ncbi:pyridoxal 5'-phosphate synthase glutaminase subunit PdxT [Rummeliibacillus suwonensis]|jgi:5'-phosphate synthase pdxT subunit|uniref:pyridoxal 5'-phosphate synthase glutaminase subunit PdxT n=1 Tax=Rummeliibacillus suwonensis TaxID=1306154 RepID=UPI0028A011F8|nr:pyridoxal 5'-phosphate synthase glutaminase subunit PdxT [Rummeliibacillus suwonensis]
MVRIGVLALQGAVREHIKAIEAVGAKAVSVKHKDELQDLDGLILPGGESTTMRKLIDRYDMMQALRIFASTGKPMFGTCAGLILLAKKLVDGEPHIGVMDIEVKRNSFGRQIDSFEALLDLKDIGSNFPAVFIRAPHIVNVGKNVDVLGKYDGRIVLARDGQFLGCSFHPELTEDTRIMGYFVHMVKESKRSILA